MSGDSSSEHWSFENLTQTTDSGHLRASNDSLKNLNLPLSLVLNPDIRGPTTLRHPTRSLSNGSTRGAHFLRRQVAPRPDSITSDTLSVHQSPRQNSSRQRLLSSTSQHSMAGSTSDSPYRTSESVAAPVPRSNRESTYSDRAVYALSRSPERNLRPYGSSSPPPTMPPAVQTRLSDGARREFGANMTHGSDDQLTMQQSIVALNGQRAAETPKTYALPTTSAPIRQPQPEAYQRARVERDYSQVEARRFTVSMPVQLRGRIDEQQFKKFIRRLNKLLAEAEGATLRNVLEGCLAYATLYMSTLLIKPHAKRTVELITAFIAHENKHLFEPAGLLVIDPLQTAYMFVEIVVL
ncbi:Golgin sub A member 7 [Coemansia sp. RSA 353]|nr:Golgin sub A member 7 [Coemansia sp. RSA 788]KAJ2149020.1 Golgin sub A member 7 [Coemansia sp. RSA 564]KAJ2149990.1 Golgin sub A member 7 [Coemansia sp. RSA 637]KAJ2165285.1 Golgin sub A member 7 [Coemansia sp. RSA 562]KAJ2226963.1 Golgin sub A member 7 [Coemansia sp. RSA 518]KAJ2276469.1 Golgin sub A member 7 [Coemansia sp. RSA 371]KAJ2290528.1 Golgin sub A member 7 [Coemansia sp. RSA 355]KAJ2299577.1 Golgin sub A member 7 [Coemansia sp. RSA 353]KAJ2529783.1 Golgin sub A member 7 [Coema